MLPDFPNAKKHFDHLFSRQLRAEIARRAPLLAKIHHSRQHEGQRWVFTGVEGHADGGIYKKLEARFALTREEMKEESLAGVFAKLGELAEQLAKAQSDDLYEKVSHAADSVGNVVRADGQFTKEHFLEMVRKIQTDFDVNTQEPRHASVVLHPDTWAKIKDDVESWEQDAEFLQSLREIENQQRVAWRDRESRRRLVD